MAKSCASFTRERCASYERHWHSGGEPRGNPAQSDAKQDCGRLAGGLTASDIDLLERLTAQAIEVPCLVRKADLFPLLALAGFDAQARLWRELIKSTDPVLISPEVLRMLIDWVLNPANSA